MTTEHILNDPELGAIILRTDAWARRLTFRMKDGHLHATLPPGTSRSRVQEAIEQLRPRLHKAFQKGQYPRIDLDYHIDADLFHLSLETGNGKQFQSHSCPGKVLITCPPHTQFDDETLQAWLRRVVVEAMRRQAKQILPPRLSGLARHHGLTFRNLKINTGHTRWGSCSAAGDINLSCYLMLLPARLVDYVLLHELSHTREMNHGERFWQLLDRLTEGQAKALRQEIRQYSTQLPDGN